MPGQDNRPRSRPGRRLLAVVLLAVVFGAGLLTAFKRPDSTATTSPGLQLAALEQAQASQLALGRRVFLRDCAFCHGDHGEGTSDGPRLTHVGTAYVDFMLTTGRMPLTNYRQPKEGPPAYPPPELPHKAPAYSPSVIKAIVAYTGTFITSGPPVPLLRPGDPVEGRDLFLTNCAPCHSSSGTGMILPAGVFAPDLFDASPKQVGEAVRVGPGPMPPFPSTQLDKSELNDLVTYVGDLGSPQDIGGHPLDYFGPIIEGIIAWVIPIPLLVIIIRMMGKKAP